MADNASVNKLVDSFGRTIDYLRISITDRCNLNCIYCRPKSQIEHLSHLDILRYEEILEIIKVAGELGIKKFRITGGEPLVRKGLVGFLERLAKMGVDFSLTTNGILLSDFAQDLFNAGLKRINISLDSLQPERFSQITRGGELSDVLAGIEKAKALFSTVKINMVVMRGTNEDEINDFVDKALTDGLHIRFIEFMDLFSGEDRFVSLKEIKKRLIAEKDLLPIEEAGLGPAINYYSTQGKGSVGFITPRSQPFCSQCNRLRLTSDGKLKLCLASKQAIDIKTPLRNGEGMKKLKRIFIEAAQQKPKGHNFKFDQINLMSSIGG